MARILRLYDKGDDVEQLQAILNTASPTRLPRLSVDGDFGVMTKARVMELQHHKKIGVDGVVGDQTYPALDALLKFPPKKIALPSGKVILVNLMHRKLRTYKNGILNFEVRPIRGGSFDDQSTQGVFTVDPDRCFRHHTSAQFPEPPGNMDFSLFYHQGEAIHQGPPDEFSHGCIHVGSPEVERVFEFGKVDNVMVIVVKERKSQ